jgi:LacI family transcriptional regulator
VLLRVPLRAKNKLFCREEVPAMTIKDLAEITGYGVGTISRVLNNQSNVSEKARKAILQAVEESGFQINTNAKQLKQHANSILVVVKGTANEMFSEMMETIQNLITQTQYPLYVDYMDEDGNEVLRAIQLSREKKPLGILFLGGNSQNFSQDFEKIQVPCVLVSNDASELPFSNLSSVCTDDRQAARCAVDSLVALGHRKFAMVGGYREASDTSRLRYEGCIQALQNHGIDFDEKLDYQGVRYSYQDGYNATMQLLANGRKFTALFAAADVMAIGAIRAICDRGMRVPEDISVIGFDGLEVGRYMTPRLTTIRQHREAIANRSVEILLDNIEGPMKKVHEVKVFNLMPGESVRMKLS